MIVVSLAVFFAGISVANHFLRPLQNY